MSYFFLLLLLNLLLLLHVLLFMLLLLNLLLLLHFLLFLLLLLNLLLLLHVLLFLLLLKNLLLLLPVLTFLLLLLNLILLLHVLLFILLLLLLHVLLFSASSPDSSSATSPAQISIGLLSVIKRFVLSKPPGRRMVTADIHIIQVHRNTSYIVSVMLTFIWPGHSFTEPDPEPDSPHGNAGHTWTTLF